MCGKLNNFFFLIKIIIIIALADLFKEINNIINKINKI